MSSAGNRSSSVYHVSNRPPISFSSYCIANVSNLTQRPIDESRLIKKATSECYQHSTPLTTDDTSSSSLSSQSTTTTNVHRRKVNNNDNNHASPMTSFSALKRKAQRSDFSSSLSRFQPHLEHVFGFTSLSNSIIDQHQSTLAYAAGSTIVLYDIETQKQDFVINNVRKSISSLSLSNDGRYLATGESGHDPKVRVWDLNADKTVSTELGDHKFAIDAVCFSPNADRLVSIGSIHDGNIYVWNWKDKKKLASNKCTCSVRRLSFSENGNYFVTVGNRHVKFWYLAPEASLEVVPLRGRYAILVERKDNFFTDVVCGRGDCSGMTYVITSSGLICQFDEHRQMQAERDLQEKSNCLAIGNDYLVVGCVKGAVYIFNPQKLDFIMSIPLPHSLGVDIGFVKSIDQMKYFNQTNVSFPDTIGLCLDENRSLLTCFYNDHSFYIWNIENADSISKYDSHLYHSDSGWSIENFTKNNTQSSTICEDLSFISCSSDNTIRFWSLNSNLQDSLITSSSSNIFSRELIKIIYLDEDFSKLCDHQNFQERPEFVPKIGGRSLKINPDGLSMAVGDRHGNVRILNLNSFKQIVLLEAHDSEVLSLDYSRSSLTDFTFLASSSRDRFIHVFDVNKDYQLIATLDDHSAAITSIRFAFSPTNRSSQLISCGADKSLIFRSIVKNENGKFQFVRSSNTVEKQSFYDLVTDSTHETVSTACQDRVIRVYNLQDGKRLRTYKSSMNDDNGYLIKIDIDQNGKFLATSCSNKFVYIWDLQSSECVASLCGHGEIVTDLKFSPDGSFLYAISGDSCIFVWNIFELTTNSRPPRILSFSDHKSIELEPSESEERNFQSPNIIEEHRPNVKRQRSFWSTSEPLLPSFDKSVFRSTLPDIINENHFYPMTHSTSSHDEETIFRDRVDNENFSNKTNKIDRFENQVHPFLVENYDHEHSPLTSQFDQRKSVSSRFRSVKKQISLNDETSTNLTSTPEHCSTNSHLNKYTRSQSIQSTNDFIESKSTMNRPSNTKINRSSRTRSEDRFRVSSICSTNNSIDSTTSSQTPSYAAHTSSSMNKLRDSSIPPTPNSSNSTTNSQINSNQNRRTNSSISTNRSISLSRKVFPKSNSTQNLILPSTIVAQNLSSNSSNRLKSSNFSRRPENLPMKSNFINSSSSSSSSSSNPSSPIKTTPFIDVSSVSIGSTENQPISSNSSTDDLMPKWAQDCFYRTVVLGLKPILLQDSPTSPVKTVFNSTSSESIESSESFEISNEIQLCTRDKFTNEIQIRKTLSIADYQQTPPTRTNSTREKSSIKSEEKSNIEDHRVPVVDDLFDVLDKRLNELENLYSKISTSSDQEDLMLKKYIEKIFVNLQTRLNNYQQQQIRLSTTSITE